MKERYALVKFRPFLKHLYTYACDNQVKKGYVVTVDTSDSNIKQEVLVAKIKYIKDSKLPVPKNRIRKILSIVSKNHDNTKFCENRKKRYLFTPNPEIEKNWIKTKSTYKYSMYDVPFRYALRHVKNIAHMGVFFSKKSWIIELEVGNFSQENFFCKEIICSSIYEFNYVINRIKTEIQKYIAGEISIDMLEQICIAPNDRPEYW